MTDVIYYDENPTVREIVIKILQDAGLNVLRLGFLADIEQTLMRASVDQLLILLDLSTQPQEITRLQAIIPLLVGAPERCILTTVNPAALASYLPQNVDEAFFKHVVERPFKRLAFIDFIRDLLLPLGFDHNLHPWEQKLEANFNAAPQNIPQPANLPIASSISEVVLKSRDSGILLFNSDPDDEVENTDLISPDLTRELLASAGVEYNITAPRPSEPYLSGQSSVEYLTDLFLGIAKRRISCVFELNIEQLNYVIFISFGQIRWIEKYLGPNTPSVQQALENIPDSPLLPKDKLTALLIQSLSLDSAIAALNLTDAFETHIFGYFSKIFGELLNSPPQRFSLFRPNQSPYEQLVGQRPVLNLPIGPMLFDYYRVNGEIIIAPYYVSNMLYLARSRRSPINQAVKLSEQEELVLRFLRSPLSHRDLKARRIKDALDILYRLSLFEFIDEVSPQLNLA